MEAPLGEATRNAFTVTTAALLAALAVHKASEKGGGSGKWPTSTGHVQIQGPGMRNCQVAEDPRGAAGEMTEIHCIHV